jgi:hypothetical protein
MKAEFSAFAFSVWNPARESRRVRVSGKVLSPQDGRDRERLKAVFADTRVREVMTARDLMFGLPQRVELLLGRERRLPRAAEPWHSHDSQRDACGCPASHEREHEHEAETVSDVPTMADLGLSVLEHVGHIDPKLADDLILPGASRAMVEADVAAKPLLQELDLLRHEQQQMIVRMLHDAQRKVVSVIEFEQSVLAHDNGPDLVSLGERREACGGRLTVVFMPPHNPLPDLPGSRR